VNEFTCAGEVSDRPLDGPSSRELYSYLYFRRNVAGVQREWWFHRFGCKLWFFAERDTRTNEVLKTDAARPPGGPAPEGAAIPDTPAV
jgi:heterotetrameric sarcosine oxidase delta subunit